ncbi:MAG: peptidyl-prolyl cis-trans isomerase [Nanoarchaeota archaeon]|nr:peptidyl-prolyl cis-trans isomerase [Nanoarchaeota archaeon]MBU4456757.1 peptidyl-prolyl cis-trans isomerase [Nanoarchaeota archaeon]
MEKFTKLFLGLLLVLVIVLIYKGGNTMAEVSNEVVVLETSKGIIEVELDREHAPITVENFLSYVNEGFFEGTIFHRVISGFMIQGGGFLPDGSQKETKAPIKLESNNELKNVVGTIAMARTMVPDSATSQFFINTVDNDFLNYAPGNDGYAVFGKVIVGMDVVKAIEAVETSSNGANQDWPVEDVVIEKAYLI